MTVEGDLPLIRLYSRCTSYTRGIRYLGTPRYLTSYLPLLLFRSISQSTQFFNHLHSYFPVNSPLPMEIPPLQPPQRHISHRCKPKGQLKSNVPPITDTNQLSNRSNIPHLRHAHRRPHDTKPKCKRGGDSGRQEFRLVIVFGGVAAHSLLEDEVFG